MPPMTLLVEKVVHGGCGLVRTGEGVVLVPGVLPGERITALPGGRRRGMAVVRLLEVLEPSPDRCAPPCPHFGVCGGCDWLFIKYERQVALKKEIFLEAMRRIGKLSAVPEPDIIVSPQFGYRRRVQFKIDDAKKIGFFRRESNVVVAVARCPLLTERCNELLLRCTATPATLPDGLDTLRAIDGDETIASHPVLAGITRASTFISCGPATFEAGGEDFFQGNRYLLERMCGWAAAHRSGSVMADLYGGTGFFSLLLAGSFDKGWLIESDWEMVRRAKNNFRRNNVGNIQAVSAPAESMERYLSPRPDFLIVDPPRPGLSRKVNEVIARCAPETVMYVSCNCATQARDCGFLVQEAGYEITAAALIDLYPNTHHTESIILLKKKQRASRKL